MIEIRSLGRSVGPFLKSFRTHRKASLLFALRATAASAAAWSIAMWLHLDNPQWAAVTVWIVAQPSRGMTLSKGFYRLFGTCLGALMSIVLIVFLGEAPWAFIFVLALWMGLCSMIANTVLYFQSYAAVLAGYTASIVGLLVFSHTNHVYEVAIDRVICVMLGIFVAGLFASLLAKSETKPELFRRIRLSLAEAMELLAHVAARSPRSEKMRLERFLVAEASAIEELSAYAAAESMQIRMRISRAHNVIASLLSVLSAARGLDILLEKRTDLLPALAPGLAKVSELARRIAATIRETQTFSDEPFAELRREVVAVTLLLTGEHRHQDLLVERMRELTHGIETIVDEVRSLTDESKQRSAAVHLSHHRDWKIARLAGARALVGVLIGGAIWQLTGWHSGPILLMMVAVNCGVFATRPDPVAALVATFKACGVAYVAAFLTYFLFLSPNSSMGAVLAAQLPFLIPGGILLANSSTSLVGALYAANYEVFLSPNHPMVFDLKKYADLGLGFFAGVALSWAVFRFILPAHPKQHVEALRNKVVSDLSRLVHNNSATLAVQWETRMYHRISRMITISTELGGDTTGLVDGGLAALQIGRDVLLLRGQGELENESRHAVTSEIISEALGALDRLPVEPAMTSARLRTCAERMRSLAGQDASLGRHRERLAGVLDEMAETVLTHVHFFSVKLDGKSA